MSSKPRQAYQHSLSSCAASQIEVKTILDGQTSGATPTLGVTSCRNVGEKIAQAKQNELTMSSGVGRITELLVARSADRHWAQTRDVMCHGEGKENGEPCDLKADRHIVHTLLIEWA